MVEKGTFWDFCKCFLVIGGVACLIGLLTWL